MVPIRRLLVFLFFINSATRLFFAHTHQGIYTTTSLYMSSFPCSNELIERKLDFAGENAAKTRHYAHFNAKVGIFHHIRFQTLLFLTGFIYGPFCMGLMW